MYDFFNARDQADERLVPAGLIWLYQKKKKKTEKSLKILTRAI